MPYVDRLYLSNAVPGLPGILLRGVGLGGLLAAAHRAYGRNLAGDCAMGRGHAAWRVLAGLLLGGNIAGAVFGCLLAGFYLLRVYDMTTATYVAAAINGPCR